MDPLDIKELVQAIKEGNREAVPSREQLREKAKVLVESKKNIAQIREEVRKRKELAKGNTEATKIVNQFSEAVEDSIDEHRKYEKSLRHVGSAVLGFGRAAAAGEGSISAFTDNLKGFNIIGDSFANIGQRLDTNIETFRQLAQTGANFGQSIVEMRRAAGQALLPLDDFAQLVGQNANNLAALFGSTTVGAQRIAELSERFRTTGVDSLAPLGFTVDEINETLLLNLERQRRTFNFDANARQQNVASAMNLAKQLDRLAKLTGTQREELQAQIEAGMSNERFLAFLGGQTDEVATRMQAFSGTIGAIAPDLNEGFQDLIANAGIPVTEAALQLVQNMPEARVAVQNLISGLTTSEEALMSIRNAAVRSQDRFRKATVTGTVEFLRLQKGVVDLGSRNYDLNAIMAEQGATATSLTQGLTTFQHATKRLSGQFQKIETSLLSAFGPALGGLVTGLQGLMGGFGGIAALLAKVPALTGTALAGIIVGRYLFDKATQIGIIAAGTAIGTGKLSGLLGRMGGAAGKVGKFGLTRALPAVGAIMGVGSSAGMLMDKDKSNDAAGKGGLAGAAAGAATGAALGSIIPGLGTIVGGLIGAGLGAFGGQAIGGAIGKKAFGGPIDVGKSYLVGEKGPEVITSKTTGTVTATTDLAKVFSTEALENKMTNMVTELNTANKTLTSMVDGVNTLVSVNNKTRKATEDNVRATKNATGNVLYA